MPILVKICFFPLIFFLKLVKKVCFSGKRGGSILKIRLTTCLQVVPVRARAKRGDWSAN